jgi:hypothetical protein
VRDWLKMTLSAEDRKRVGHDMMTVEYGWPLGMPTCRHLEGGVHEVRTNVRADGAFARIHQENPADSRPRFEPGARQQEEA